MYVDLRKEKSNNNAAGYMYITPRTLLAIIRLSQAMARLSFSNEVTIDHVNEALRLMKSSRSSIGGTEPEAKTFAKMDRNSKIFTIIKDLWYKYQKKAIRLDDVAKIAEECKYTIENVHDCIKIYEDLNAVHYDPARNEIKLIG